MVRGAFIREREENRCFERTPTAMYVRKKGNQLERSKDQHSKSISIYILKAQSERVFFYR